MSWAHVQKTGANNATAGLASSLSATFGSSVTAGNLVIVGVSTFDSSTITVQDSISTANYSQAVLLGTTAMQAGIWWFVVPPGKGGSGFDITVAGSTAGALAMSIDEFSFTPGATISVDATGTGNVANATPGITTPGTTLTPTGSDLIYAVNCMGANLTFTPGAGFTQSYQGTWTTGKAENCCTEYALNQSSVITPAATLASSTAWVFVAAAFLATPAAAPSGGGSSLLCHMRSSSHAQRMSRRRILSRDLR